MLDKFAGFIVKRRWWIIIAWVVLAGLIVGLSPQLTSVESNDQSSFLPSTYESVRASNLAKKINPKDSGASDIIVFQTKSGTALSTSDLQSINTIVQELNAAHLSHVATIITGPQQVSPNHKAQLAQVAYVGDPQNKDVINAVPTLRNAVSIATASTDLKTGGT